MKICNKCGIEKERDKFSKKTEAGDGLQTVCKQCFSEYAHTPYKRYRKEYMKEYMKGESQKKKNRCRSLLNWRIKMGKVKKRNICEICYAQPTECHHDNYDEVNSFVELCKKCHTAVHYKQFPREPELQTF